MVRDQEPRKETVQPISCLRCRREIEAGHKSVAVYMFAQTVGVKPRQKSGAASTSRKSAAGSPMGTLIATATSIFCSPPTTDQRICIATICSVATAASVFVW